MLICLRLVFEGQEAGEETKNVRGEQRTQEAAEDELNSLKTCRVLCRFVLI